MPDLYDELKAAGCEIDAHESDLYVLATDEARGIVAASGRTFSPFVSQRDGRVWFDVPFAFKPWWDARTKR